MKSTLKMGLVLVLAVLGAWLVWQWGFCRFYVGPGQMAVITAKTGRELPAGQILAKKGERGIQEDVLGEGRHFLNPWLYERDIRKVVEIPPGKVGVVTSKIGESLPDGEFLAERGQKGIWRNVLGPGKYRMNPVGYQIDIVDAISIPIGYDGVVTSLSGAQTPPHAFAQRGEKGVRSDVLQPGLYFVNPREFKVDVLEIGVNQVSLLGKGGGAVITKALIASDNVAMSRLQQNVLQEQQEKRADYMRQESSSGMRLGRLASMPSPAARATDAKRMREAEAFGGAAPAPAPDLPSLSFVLNQFVEFPSRDGFEISLDMTVEFELLPKDVAWLFPDLRRPAGGGGQSHHAADPVGVAPEGLGLRGEGFHRGRGPREVPERADGCAGEDAGGKAHPHPQRVDPARERARPDSRSDPAGQPGAGAGPDQPGEAEHGQAAGGIEYRAELDPPAPRAGRAGDGEDQGADPGRQEKQVAEIRGDTMRQAAEIEKQTAGVRAERITTLGTADAEVVRLVEGERAKGLQLKVKAFGDPEAYNLWTLASALSDDLKINILHAGPARCGRTWKKPGWRRSARAARWRLGSEQGSGFGVQEDHGQWSRNRRGC
jgi:hypothetical protein